MNVERWREGGAVDWAAGQDREGGVVCVKG